MRRPLTFFTTIHSRLRSKLGLGILLLLLIAIIVILFLFSVKSTPQPSPSPAHSPSPDSPITSFNTPHSYPAAKTKLASSNQLYSIDPETHSLVKITPEEVIVVYPDPVKSFSHQDSKLALIDRLNKSTLILHNLNTSQNNLINLSSISPLIDVSFSPQEEGLYLLANLDVINRTTDLFYLPLENPIPQKLSTTKATQLEALPDQNILLFSSADAIDLSTVSVFNLPNRQTSFSTKANKYFISPSKNSVCAISSKKVTLFNLNNQVPKSYHLEKILGAYWLSDPELVLVKNTPEGVAQASITPLTDAPTFKLTSSLKDKNLRSIIGYLDNQLYAIDYFHQLVKISL